MSLEYNTAVRTKAVQVIPVVETFNHHLDLRQSVYVEAVDRIVISYSCISERLLTGVQG